MQIGVPPGPGFLWLETQVQAPASGAYASLSLPRSFLSLPDGGDALQQ